MRKIYIKLLVLFLLYSSTFINISGTYYGNEVNITGNTFTTGYWREPVLDFYLNSSKTAVGFNVVHISAFDSLDYQITYNSDGGVKGIVGTISIGGVDSITRDDLILGTCSTGGVVCTYDTGITSLHMKLTLYASGGNKVLEQDLDY